VHWTGDGLLRRTVYIGLRSDKPRNAGSTGGLAKGIVEISVRRTTPSTAGMRKKRSSGDGSTAPESWLGLPSVG